MAREPFPLPTSHERYCVFVDILGFRQLVDGLANVSIPYETLRGVLSQIHAPASMQDDSEESDLRAQCMSDAICVSTKCPFEGLRARHPPRRADRRSSPTSTPAARHP
jgi:hypothetical protein